MYKDFPAEAAGLRFFVIASLAATLGLVVWLVAANPMNGDASPTTRATVVQHD